MSNASFGFTPRLLIDGAIDNDEIEVWHRPAEGIATGEFRGQQGLQLDCPSNPHSGCFGISRRQLMVLRSELPRDGFVVRWRLLRHTP